MNKTEIVKKLKALSDRGIDGEKENATKLLNKLMEKYGISEEELEQPQTKTVWITLKNNAEIRICSQILYAYFNDAKLWKRRGCRTKYWIELTPAQEIEFKYMLQIYLDSFYKEQDILIYAFVQKNKIFPTDSPVSYLEDLTPEEKEKTLRASLMQEGMEFTRIRKALDEKKGEIDEKV